MIRAALDRAGGVEYLAAQAKATPAAFLALVGRLLPVEQRLTGADGGPIQYADTRAANLALVADLRRRLAGGDAGEPAAGAGGAEAGGAQPG